MEGGLVRRRPLLLGGDQPRVIRLIDDALVIRGVTEGQLESGPGIVIAHGNRDLRREGGTPMRERAAFAPAVAVGGDEVDVVWVHGETTVLRTCQLLGGHFSARFSTA